MDIAVSSACSNRSSVIPEVISKLLGVNNYVRSNGSFGH